MLGVTVFGKNTDGGCVHGRRSRGVKSLAIDIEHWRHIGHEQWMAENQLNLLGRPWWEGYSTQDLLHDEHNQVPIFASWGVLLYYPSPMHYDLWELVCDMANSTHLYLPENFLVQILGWLNKNSRFKKSLLGGDFNTTTWVAVKHGPNRPPPF